LPPANCQLDIYSDSELLVKQLNGSYKVKNPTLKHLFVCVKSLLGKYKRVKIYHVLRENNAGADKLANEAIRNWKLENKKK
jgi:ribonuclease HI